MDRLRQFAQDRLPGLSAGLMRAIFLIFLLVPFVVAIPVSFSNLAVFPPNAFTFRWYEAFFASKQFNDAWVISLVLALLSATISTVVGAAFALAVTRHEVPGKQILIALILSPLIVPGVATGIGLLFYFTYIGLLDGWARLLVAHVIVTMPYVARIMTATLHSFDRSIEEAAMNLGATEPQVLLTITLPAVRAGLAAAFVLAFMASFENLPVTAFVAQPGFATMPVILFSYVRDEFNPIVAVVTVVMIAIAALTMLIIDRVIGVERVMGLETDRK